KRPRATGFEVIPKAADTIRLIFDMKLKGIGLPAIEAELNTRATWLPPLRKGQKTQGWRQSYIKKLLANPAVMGVYQPFSKTTGSRLPAGEPITGYFPTIIDPSVFHAVQERNAENRGRGGQTGKVNNLLAHLVKCPYCGSPMAFDRHGGKW